MNSKKENKIKNIWMLNHYGIPPELGPLNRHYMFAKNLNNRGYNTTIFASSALHYTNENMITTNEDYIVKKYSNVPFIFLKTNNYYGNGKKRIINMYQYFKQVIKLTKKINIEKPDVIFATSPHPLTWLAGYFLAKRYKVKLIVETRDLWPEVLIHMGGLKRKGLIATLLFKLEKFIYNKADKLVFTVEGGKDYLEEIGIDPSKANYINNGIDIDEFNYNKENNIYEDIDLDDNYHYKIVYTGSMGVANELNYIVETAKMFRDNGYNNIKFILFGDGYKKPELEKYVEENNLKNVKFKGLVEKKYIPNILTKSNLNIYTGKNIPLYKYGLSLNKMFDYFASGIPTLSNFDSGYDMLEENKVGITVKSGSVEALYEGILRFNNMDKKEYDTYSKNSLKLAKDFDFKILTDKLEEIIKDIENNI
ncbi:MAG: glycosyltransferase family 4 protein [Fusobacteria bacterium]|nr:glycosyltransferase family 4 protein [Fusobacteriota bacterium]